MDRLKRETDLDESPAAEVNLPPIGTHESDDRSHGDESSESPVEPVEDD